MENKKCKQVMCPQCKTKIDLTPNRKLKYCQCELLCVDCDPLYTRFIGPYIEIKDEIIEPKIN